MYVFLVYLSSPPTHLDNTRLIIQIAIIFNNFIVKGVFPALPADQSVEAFGEDWKPNLPCPPKLPAKAGAKEEYKPGKV